MPREKSNKQLSKEVQDQLKALHEKAKAVLAKINNTLPPTRAT